MAQELIPVTLIPGDGIGPEVVNATVELLAAAGAPIAWEHQEAGGHLCATLGTALPDAALESIARNKIALKGPITTPIGGGFASVNVTLRQKLNLYANLRPARSLPGIKTRYEDVDIIVVRENTEDLYAGKEHMIVPGVVESLKIITEKASTNIARFAFAFSRQNNRKKVTAVHKANIMKMSDGLFLDCCRAIAREYPDVEYNEVIVDNLCMQLVTDPTRYDVLVLENLYGDIVSDLCAGLVGGLGVVPAGNIGIDCALFEAVHGSAPDIAGQGKANPTAVMLSAVLMLRHLNLMEVADRIEKAVHLTLKEGTHLTPDLRGKCSTQDYTKAVIGNLA
jgi:isocitrate dehydrogenase (NAD+)